MAPQHRLRGRRLPPCSCPAAWTAKQQQAVANLLRIRSLVKQYITRQDIEATTEFLYAASHGNIPKIRQVQPQAWFLSCPLRARRATCGTA